MNDLVSSNHCQWTTPWKHRYWLYIWSFFYNEINKNTYSASFDIWDHHMHSKEALQMCTSNYCRHLLNITDNRSSNRNENIKRGERINASVQRLATYCTIDWSIHTHTLRNKQSSLRSCDPKIRNINAQIQSSKEIKIHRMENIFWTINIINQYNVQI